MKRIKTTLSEWTSLEIFPADLVGCLRTVLGLFLSLDFHYTFTCPLGKTKEKNDHFSSLLSITPTCVCSLSFQTASQDERAVSCCALQTCLSIRNPSGGIRSDVLIMESFLIFLGSSSASLLKVRRIPQAVWKDLGGAAGSGMDLA